MNIKLSIIIILIIIIILFFISCTSSCHKTHNSNKEIIPSLTTDLSNENSIIEENRSNIVAEVLSVVKLNEQRFFLRLKVNKTDPIPGFVNYALLDTEIEVYPNYLRKECQSEIDYSSVINKHMHDASSLENGDIINANVYKTNSQKGNWSLVSWHK